MPSIENSLDKFNGLDPEFILTIDSEEVAAVIGKIAAEYKIGFGVLSSLLIFLVVGDLREEEAVKYLREKGIELSAAEAVFSDFRQRVIVPLSRRIEFLNVNPRKKMTVKEEKEILLEMFGKKLLRELDKHTLILNNINVRIFYILNKEPAFQDELARALLANKENVSNKEFIIDGRPATGNIANWIQQFIKDNGSALFDSVILSRFFTVSRNIKKLNDRERELVRKILLVYRNLKFFPESMPNDTGEGWQILPFEIPAEEKLEQAKEKIESLPQQVATPDKNARPDKIEEEKIKATAEQLEQLKNTAENYPRGSLSRKAVEEEIKKLEGRSKK